MNRWLGALALGPCMAAFAQGHDVEVEVLPLEHASIRYSKTPAVDRAAKFAARLKAGEIGLAYDDEFGYLPAVLRALDVPVESQVLVFSKTSFQAARIFPRLPRAIYFNDDVAVGWVRGGDVVEMAAPDPVLGATFYSLDQEQTARPVVERHGNDCLQCHHSPATAGVPGMLVRSVVPDRAGKAMFPGPSFITDHRSPLHRRWGGWYVTGTHGTMRHMGNSMLERGADPEKLDNERGANVTDLKPFLDTGLYLSGGSDIVALLVLEHQTRLTNLLARAVYQLRLGKPAELDEIVRYMTFADEAALEAPVKGLSGFAAGFTRRGPRDKRGRSLRDFDLSKRMFRYPLSYMFHSAAFDGMPAGVRDPLLRRIFDALEGRAGFDAGARAAIEIARETKPGLPGYWRRELQ